LRILERSAHSTKRFLPAASAKVRLFISTMSAPAAKALSIEEDSTIAATDESAS
jgi:hypothetical protein